MAAPPLECSAAVFLSLWDGVGTDSFWRSRLLRLAESGGSDGIW